MLLTDHPCDGTRCPSRNNCLRHVQPGTAPKAALWARREPGATACDQYRAALAAAEAREMKLLQLIEKLPCESENLLWEAISEKRDVLAQPRDDSALREMIAGVYEKCARWYANEGWLLDEYDVPDAIRALAEKARHGS